MTSGINCAGASPLTVAGAVADLAFRPHRIPFSPRSTETERGTIAANPMELQSAAQ
jgi:hypothetical protein